MELEQALGPSSCKWSEGLIPPRHINSPVFYTSGSPTIADRTS